MKDEEQRRIGFILPSVPALSAANLISSISSPASQSITSRQTSPTSLFPAPRHRRRRGCNKQQPGRATVITTDLLVEDIDFRRDSSPPVLLGHKALAVSLSDHCCNGRAAAMGLVVRGRSLRMFGTAILSMSFTKASSDSPKRYDVRLIGGDVSRTPEKIVIDSIALGECDAERSVYRSGAKPGDLIYVTGSLGAAAAGLRLIERGARVGQEHPDEPEWKLVQELLLRQLRPEPRVGWGLVLGEERLASAMIDISDGLSSDLNHLCRESNVGALMDANRLPVDAPVADLCGRRALDPLLLALHGGEDFELLFTVLRKRSRSFR